MGLYAWFMCYFKICVLLFCKLIGSINEIIYQVLCLYSLQDSVGIQNRCSWALHTANVPRLLNASTTSLLGVKLVYTPLLLMRQSWDLNFLGFLSTSLWTQRFMISRVWAENGFETFMEHFNPFRYLKHLKYTFSN